VAVEKAICRISTHLRVILCVFAPFLWHISMVAWKSEIGWRRGGGGYITIPYVYMHNIHMHICYCTFKEKYDNIAS
jgi:hypothetical protein